MTARSEAIARLRCMMASYPCLDAETEAALGRMHWRARRAVVLMYGEGCTQIEAARRLGVSQRTVARDLDTAATVMAELATLASVGPRHCMETC